MVNGIGTVSRDFQRSQFRVAFETGRRNGSGTPTKHQERGHPGCAGHWPACGTPNPGCAGHWPARGTPNPGCAGRSQAVGSILPLPRSWWELKRGAKERVWR